MVSLIRDRVGVADRSVLAMSQPASIVAAEAMLEEALRLLLDAGSTYLVVIASGGRFAGVLGGRQLVAAWADCPGALATTPVTAVLDPAPPTVAPTATVRTAARMIRDYRSDVVVIIGPDRAPVGVVTASDLLAGIADPI
jgi:CBS domain-containing protein